MQKADLDPLAESLLISLANHLDIWFHSDSIAIVFRRFSHIFKTFFEDSQNAHNVR